MYKLCRLLFIISSLVFSQENQEDHNLLGNDFDIINEDYQNTVPQRYILIAKKINDELHIAHFNDLDLTGIASLLGYPEDDDLGRTAGIMLNYRLYNMNSSLELNLENWLFSRSTNNPNVDDQQIIEENIAVSIRSRRLQNENSDQYIILGFEFRYDMQKTFIMSFLQKIIHDITPSRTRPIINRDQETFMLTPLFGIGLRFDFVKNSIINIYSSAEIEAHASSDFFERSHIRARVQTGIDFLSVRNNSPPRINLSFIFEYAQFLDGSTESQIGMSFSVCFRLKKGFITPGIAVTRWKSRLDYQYADGESWNTAVFVRLYLGNNSSEYLFN